MAEFSEVVRQFRRICKDGCVKCPMLKEHGDCWERAREEPEEFERRVMEWAEEHPEPVYPTWIEWLRDMKIIESGIGVVPMCVNDSIYAQIPEDIAKNLGIKPKGTSDD